MVETSLNHFHRAAVLFGSMALLLVSQVGQAQQSRYSSDWRQTPSPGQNGAVAGRSAELDELLKELERLTSEAERGRAADPRFLADLKDLARRYSWPWHKLVVLDDFQDGDYSRNPQWVVSSGSFAVRPEGLVTTVAAPSRDVEPNQTTEPPPEQDSGDFARQLLGGVLKELSRDHRGNDTGAAQQNAAAARQSVSEARIHLRRQVPNQFAVRVELQSRTRQQGRLELGVGQGPNALGYFLVYNAGSSPALSLVRKGTRGSAVIEAVSERISLEDGQTHALLFTRDKTGDMTVALDGKTKFRVSDRAFRSPFDRFVVSNTGGDFSIQTVAIYGAP